MIPMAAYLVQARSSNDVYTLLMLFTPLSAGPAGVRCQQHLPLYIHTEAQRDWALQGCSCAAHTGQISLSSVKVR